MRFSQVDLSCKFHKIRGHRGIYPVAWHERLDVCPGRPKGFANIKILSIPVFEDIVACLREAAALGPTLLHLKHLHHPSNCCQLSHC